MNKNIWNLYKGSERGKGAIKLFTPDFENYFDSIARLIEKAKDWGSELEPEITAHMCYLTDVNLYLQGFFEKDDFDFDRLVEEFALKNVHDDANNEPVLNEKDSPIIKSNDYRRKAANMHIISLALYYECGFFKPMLLPSNFARFERNCAALGIDLPDIPKSKDYRDYLLYYFDVCKAIDDFQQECDLDDPEMCAAIYDYAPSFEMNDDAPSQNDLPLPTNIWLTGSGKGDFAYLDSLGTSDEYSGVWACNENTRPGDIVVVYCNAPRSYIHSIWRAKSGGTFNPFDHFHCRTTICDGVRIPKITFNDLMEDPYMSQVPIVRRHLMGINGVELSATDYARLLEMIKERGGDVASLPKLYEGANIDFGTISKEKDVEEKILIPVLKSIGYSEKDWTRQLALKAGRNLKAIPDFVFFAKGDAHFEVAPMVIEAKYDMGSMLERKKAFRQGLSYAKMLRSSLMGICDKERLIIYKVNEGRCDFEKPIFENHWKAICGDETVGATLNHLIGRAVVSTM